jgi:hypothetical protein
VAHLLQARGASLDWDRLLDRFGPYWPVLLSHLILFRFVYPAHRLQVPDNILFKLLNRAREEMPGTDDLLCQGTLLSRAQYIIDVNRWGYEDARLHPRGNMASEQIHHWTQAVQEEARVPHFEVRRARLFPGRTVPA